MKVLTTSLILLILQVGIAHGSIIVGNTDVPTSVLFNFQVDEANEMALLIPPVYESWQDPSFFITAATASAPPPPSGTATPTPWLDDPVDNRPGGLGVCRTTDCAGIPDDNFNMGESVLLEINQPILVGDIYFRNGQHFLVFDPEADEGVDRHGGTALAR